MAQFQNTDFSNQRVLWRHYAQKLSPRCRFIWCAHFVCWLAMRLVSCTSYRLRRFACDRCLSFGTSAPWGALSLEHCTSASIIILYVSSLVVIVRRCICVDVDVFPHTLFACDDNMRAEIEEYHITKDELPSVIDIWSDVVDLYRATTVFGVFTLML